MELKKFLKKEQVIVQKAKQHSAWLFFYLRFIIEKDERVAVPLNVNGDTHLSVGFTFRAGM